MGDQGFITVNDGARLHYRVVGHGAPTVLVPNGHYYADDLSDLWQDRAAVVYDLRNRGRSDAVSDATRLSAGVLNDLEDLDAVRRHFALSRVDLVAHSYVALIALHYAARHPACVGRVVALGPPGYGVGHAAPPPPDTVALEVFRHLGALQHAASGDAEARCRAAWEILARLYVIDAAVAPRVAAWGRCDEPNERAFMHYWTTHVEPSLHRLPADATTFSGAAGPILIVHGRRDRSASYEAGRAWAARLPDARLVTVPEAAHAVWLEAPDVVIPALRTFLDGAWPASARPVPA